MCVREREYYRKDLSEKERGREGTEAVLRHFGEELKERNTPLLKLKP